MYLSVTDFCTEKLESNFLREKDVSVSVARLDKIHPEVSGNKLFKLHYFIEECLQTDHKTILTFGGAYSNHLAATAYLCRLYNLKCIGIVRGEAAAILSHTLLKCKADGMELHFISREEYKNISNGETQKSPVNIYGNCTVVAEGGYSPVGAAGASLIMDVIANEENLIVCTPVGTGTTLAGLMQRKAAGQKIIGVPVIKQLMDIYERLQYLSQGSNLEMPEIFDDYHFGGYAKYNEELISFMNDFYANHGIPTDFVYTGKMMFAIMDKIRQGYFRKGSHIMCLHTGGLQGNQSLPAGKLIF